MTEHGSQENMARIQAALEAAVEAIRPFVPGAVAADQKSGGRGPVTLADTAADQILHQKLLRQGEGWLSEESADDFSRLSISRVWVVDPLDGTKEFVEGIPEWCISVGLVEDGRAIAGGICNPATGEIFLGSREGGLTLNGRAARVADREELAGSAVLASRSEIRRGEWKSFEADGFRIIPVGSVAYKFAMVAAGLADATWTLCPKNEWDVAAGVALVEAAGGIVRTIEGQPVTFNRKSTLYPGLVACGARLYPEIHSHLKLPVHEADTVGHYRR
jgi:myo-inositol-1(or 4)-monophosphatase